ncbi:MAG TPA: DUF1552 domain-containing protein [Thermoguttaceae bacterium]|nr:DUF1552 domain-containing protein [Thermoguttaceae bacterium]
MSRSKRITRRTALRGLGVTMALPWLEGMSRPESARAEAESKAPRRMAMFFVPNGMHMPDWTPQAEGPLDALPPILEPLEAHRSDLLVLSGLTLNGARALGDGPGDHARCVAAFLTGAHPRKTNGKDIRNGISVDQVAAKTVGQLTRFPSLELGCEPSAQSGNCDSGYSCVYTSNASWRTPTSPMAKETNPRAVFDRLFGRPPAPDIAQGGLQHDRLEKSLLDFVAEDARDLRGKLGTTDRRKLDEYLYAVRQIERRISTGEKVTQSAEIESKFPRPEGVPKEYAQHLSLMLDMAALAFWTDATRILTFMFTNAGSNRSYPEIDVRAGHHTLSHHGNDPAKQADISKINRYHASFLAKFLDRLGSFQEGDTTVLDRSMIVYGSGIGDGNRHNHNDLPILLAGGGDGTIKSGRHVRYEENTPLTDLYLSMLQRMGVATGSFSDSKGELSDLG